MSEPSGQDGLAASETRLRAILEELHTESRDVQASMVVTHDGLTMLVVGAVVDPDRFGTICAELLSLCRSAAIELERGQIEQVLMKAANGYMLLTPAGQQAELAIMLSPILISACCSLMPAAPQPQSPILCNLRAGPAIPAR